MSDIDGSLSGQGVVDVCELWGDMSSAVSVALVIQSRLVCADVVGKLLQTLQME